MFRCLFTVFFVFSYLRRNIKITKNYIQTSVFFLKSIILSSYIRKYKKIVNEYFQFSFHFIQYVYQVAVKLNSADDNTASAYEKSFFSSVYCSSTSIFFSFLKHGKQRLALCSRIFVKELLVNS